MMAANYDYEYRGMIPLNKIDPDNPIFKFKKSSEIEDETTAMMKANNADNDSLKSHMSLWIKPLIYMAGYFAANLLLTLHTKWLLSVTKFTFPWILSGLHITVSGLGAWISLKMGGGHIFTKPNGSFMIRIALFSTLYSVNIAMSNVSMKYVSLALHQVTRSGTPIITLILEFFILGRRIYGWSAASLIPVVTGIVLTVLGEMGGLEYSTLGLSLTILGVFLSSLKGVMTNFMLIGGFKLHPLELITLVAPIAALQCVFTSVLVGETSELVKEYTSKPFDGLLIVGLLANAILAFFLNWISFAVNKETSALAMTVAGNVKQAVSIGLALIIFNTPLTILNGMGIVVTLIGGIWYR